MSARSFPERRANCEGASGKKLIIFRQKVEEAGLIESSELDLIDDDLLSQVTNAVEKAKNSPLPNVEELTTNVYEKGSY